MADDGTTPGSDSPLGVYGLRVRGVDGARSLLVPVRAEWPAVTVEWTLDPHVEPGREELTGERAVLNLRTGGRLTLDRTQGTAAFRVRRPLAPHELVHPYLAPAAAVISHWLGRSCFHAGAFVSGGCAWGLVGDREAGKSSLLARLAHEGHPIVTDDVLVLDSGTAYTGPRSVDLREEAADRLETGMAIGVAGARSRWRLDLPPLEGEVPFGGWVFLAWGDEIGLGRLNAPECLSRLLRHATIRIAPAAAESHLDLAGLPAWELRRPRDWAALAETADRLLEATR